MPTNSGSRWGIDYPVVGDAVSQLRLSIVALTQAVEARAAEADRGANATRPVSTAGSPGVVGRFYGNSDLAERLDWDYGTGWKSLAFADDARFTKRLAFSFVMDEDTQLPGNGKAIGRFYAPAGALIKARCSVLSGSTSVVKFQQAGSDITGMTSIALGTSAANTTPSGITTAEQDEIRLVSVTRGDGKGLAATVYIDV